MRQTGGWAVGETSTRSRPRSRAIFNASKGGRMPSCSPFSSMTRISRARILSLVRIKDLAERLSMVSSGNERRKAPQIKHSISGHRPEDFSLNQRSGVDAAGQGGVCESSDEDSHALVGTHSGI